MINCLKLPHFSKHSVDYAKHARTSINQSGFSLIEVIIVVLLIGVTVFVIANIPHAINWISGSQTESKVRQVVAKRIEDIRLQGYDNLANGTTSITDPRLNELSGVSASTVVADCPQEICPGGELIKKVTVTVTWSESGSPKTYQVVTLVAKEGLK